MQRFEGLVGFAQANADELSYGLAQPFEAARLLPAIHVPENRLLR